MSTMVLLEMQIKPELAETVKGGLKSLLPDTRSYAGCRSIDVYENVGGKGNLVVYEQWDSRPHYERYLAWRTETGVMAELAKNLTQPPSIRFFELVDA